MKKKSLTLLVVFLTLFLFAQISMADYFDKTLNNGKVRVFFSGSQETCDAILFGVGTSMHIDGYDSMSNELLNYGYLVVIMDHNPGNMVKTDAVKFKNLVEEVKENLLTWNPAVSCNEIAHYIVGGHSAGGQAAQNAISDDSSMADAIFSMDPYNCSSTGIVDIPALYWGFDVTTCFVNKNDAAKAAYYRSSNLRAFQRVSKKYTWGPCGYSPEYFHCSVGDGHCLACTNCKLTPSYFFTDLAESVHKFINALFYGSWSKSDLQLDSPQTPVTLFIDTEQP